jgi:hypothetical protein
LEQVKKNPKTKKKEKREHKKEKDTSFQFLRLFFLFFSVKERRKVFRINLDNKDMSKFIRFTNFVLNSNDIRKILILPNKYCICIASKKLYGSSWTIGGFGTGSISSYSEEIEVCKTKDPIDYKIVSDWHQK